MNVNGDNLAIIMPYRDIYTMNMQFLNCCLLNKHVFIEWKNHIIIFKSKNENSKNVGPRKKQNHSVIHFGPSIFSGRTHSLNCSSVKYPNLMADCFNVVPSLWAVLAILAALS